MRVVKVSLIFLGLASLCLVACSNQSDYEKYSSCLLKTMNGQDKSMKHHAMESCELKYPYEKKIYWKNKIDLDFSFNPVQKTVSFKVSENNSDYSVTKIEVSGNYVTCESIPEELRKPDFLSEYRYHEQAKAELGFDGNHLRKRPNIVDPEPKEVIPPEKTEYNAEFASRANNEDYLTSLEETRRLMSKSLDKLKASEEYRQRLHEEEMRENQLKIIRIQEYARQQELIGERAAAIKEAEDQKKRLAFEVDLNEYKKAHSSWSSPVEIKFNKGIGEIDINSFGPFSSTLHAMGWAKGPECMRYIDVHGIRFR